jgi:hypothetical protein
MLFRLVFSWTIDLMLFTIIPQRHLALVGSWPWKPWNAIAVLHWLQSGTQLYFFWSSLLYHVIRFNVRISNFSIVSAIFVNINDSDKFVNTFVDRNIVGGNRSMGNDVRSPPHEATSPQEYQTLVLPLVSDEQKAELDRKIISILKEFIEIKDFQVCYMCLAVFLPRQFLIEPFKKCTMLIAILHLLRFWLCLFILYVLELTVKLIQDVIV